jgi:hypothetical protein
MATIVNARDVQLQATSPRLVAVQVPSNYSIDFSNVNGTTKPSNNADVTLSAVNGGLSVTGGGITLAGGGAIKGGQTAYNTGTGFFLGFSGAAYKFSIGDATHSLTWNGSALNYVGDMTGVGSINITGTAQFGGTLAAGGNTYAGIFNGAGGSSCGLRASANNGIAVHGIGTTSTDVGVLGIADFYGVKGQATSSAGNGVYAQDAGGIGFALGVQGKINVVNAASTGASTATLNANKPGANSVFTWIPVTVNGASGWMPWAPN